MSLFKIFGIEIRLDISVVIIFALIVFSLGSGVFPQWHPDWSPLLTWTTAIISGVVFFASLLAHELSHSVVSQHYNIPVPRITLFLFGGMAETSSEPDRPKVEFLVAIIGPVTSFVIAIACINLAFWIADDAQLVRELNAGNAEALSRLGAVSTALLWLGSINMVIAIFNMIPGFPMDGGRVFRAIIWAMTGDQIQATRWASNAGRYFGWLLMFLGVFFLFNGALSGLWWILIGWFISSIASMSYKQLISDTVLRKHRVSDLMRTRFDDVSANMSLPDFVERHLLRSSQVLWPVVDGEQLKGIVSLNDVAELSGEERQDKSVKDVMRPLDSIDYLEPDSRAHDALRRLAGAGDEPMPVIRDGKVCGLIQHRDLVKWMSLHNRSLDA
ncbi:MAG: site-2 protease family protein [Wenzhouxiangellaceae bacterium]|nr:site-2 protease family protein [Wenzhouxiangellaceae bacterium]